MANIYNYITLMAQYKFTLLFLLANISCFDNLYVFKMSIQDDCNGIFFDAILLDFAKAFDKDVFYLQTPSIYGITGKTHTWNT